MTTCSELYSTVSLPDFHIYVHNCKRQLLAQIRDPGPLHSITHVMDSKIAVAGVHSIGVWAADTGQPHASAAPADGIDGTGGFYAANKTGSRLAFCGTGRLVLYDACTLSCLGQIQLPALGLHILHLWLHWNVHGWLSLSKEHLEQSPTVLRFMQLTERVPDCTYVCHRSAISPDGAFVCILQETDSFIQIQDTRSGALLLAQTLPQEQPPLTMHNVKWSSCGSFILATISAWDAQLHTRGRQIFRFTLD